MSELQAFKIDWDGLTGYYAALSEAQAKEMAVQDINESYYFGIVDATDEVFVKRVPKYDALANTCDTPRYLYILEGIE